MAASHDEVRVVTLLRWSCFSFTSSSLQSYPHPWNSSIVSSCGTVAGTQMWIAVAGI